MKRLCLLLVLFSLWSQSSIQAVPARLARKYTLPAVKPDMAGNDIVALALSPDGKTVAYVSGPLDAGSLFLWDLRTGRQRLVEQEVSNVAFSPDGRSMASVHFYIPPSRNINNTFYALSLYDTKTGKRLRSVVIPDGFMDGLAFSPNGKTVACGDEPLDAFAQVRVYRTPTLTLQAKLVAAPLAAPSSIAFSDDGHYLGASAFAGEHAIGYTAIWSMEDHRLQHLFHNDGKVFFAPHQHTLIFNFHVHANTQPSYGLLPLARVGENRFLFCRLNKQGYARGHLELWSLAPRKKLRQWTGTQLVDYFADPVALSSDGKTLVGVCPYTQRWSVLVWRLD